MIRIFEDNAQIAANVIGRIENCPLLSGDELKRVISNGFCNGITELSVNGNDLIKMGVRGKNIGETLSFLLDRVTEDPTLNSKEKLIKIITENKMLG